MVSCILHCLSKCYTKLQFLKVSVNKKIFFRSKSQNMPVLYVDEASPPARFVMMTAHLLNIDLDIRKINLFTGEHKEESYAKINYLMKVPALVIDADDKVILDSHAAAIYLCQQVKNQQLYPNDIFLQAKVNELLFFNSSTLFRIDSEIISNYFAGKWPVDGNKIEEWHNALDYIETKLKKNIWLTCDKMYLCDLSIMQTISSMLQLLPLLSRHVKIKYWLKEFDKLPCMNINTRGLARLKYYIDLYKTSIKKY